MLNNEDLLKLLKSDFRVVEAKRILILSILERIKGIKILKDDITKDFLEPVEKEFYKVLKDLHSFDENGFNAHMENFLNYLEEKYEKEVS